MSPESRLICHRYGLERAVGISMNGVSPGDHSYTDLDFADDGVIGARTHTTFSVGEGNKLQSCSSFKQAYDADGGCNKIF